MFRSAALYDRLCFCPLASMVESAFSKALYSRFCGFCTREKERVHTAAFLVAAVKRSLIWALTCAKSKRPREGSAGAGKAEGEGGSQLVRASDVPSAFGSLTKAWPPRQLGGSSPVVFILRHSMIVVLPEPFLPTMLQMGEERHVCMGRE